MSIRILHFGLGAVGRNIARTAQMDSRLASVAAVDIAPELQGRSLADLLDSSSLPLKKLKVQSTLEKKKAQVAIHATRSWIPEISGELEALIKSGLHVVSTAEELVYPVGSKNLKIIKHLDLLAKKHKVRFIAAGVNPGFVLDFLPLVLSQATAQVDHIRASRVVDLATRRLQLQKKVGLGISVAEFNERCKDRHFGHQGMNESLHLLAAGLGLALKRTHASIRPVIAEKPVHWSGGMIQKGFILGLVQEVVGYASGKERLRLEVEMSLKAEGKNAEDRIIISGKPLIELRIPGGIAGEEATAAAIVNLIPRLSNHPKNGFCTLLDLAMVS